MQERFNEKIELSSAPEALDAVEEVTQVIAEITEQTDFVTEDQTQQPIVGLNVLPRGAWQASPET